MIDPDVNVGRDITAINSGDFIKSGADVVVNKRTYGYHPETGVLYPKSGPGFTNVDRLQHKLLKKLNDGDTAKALSELRREGLSEQKIQDVLDLWGKCQK